MRKHALEKVHDAIVESENNYTTRLILMEEGENDWSNSINAYMLAEGLAKLDDLDDADPEELVAWQDFETEACEKQLGIWKYGNHVNVDDEDY